MGFIRQNLKLKFNQILLWKRAQLDVYILGVRATYTSKAYTCATPAVNQIASNLQKKNAVENEFQLSF